MKVYNEDCCQIVNILFSIVFVCLIISFVSLFSISYLTSKEQQQENDAIILDDKFPNQISQ